jgi:hypothetical protein
MLVVVGGHSRNVGKTSVVASLIRALPEACWTAIKITQHGHGMCTIAGEPCACVTWCEEPFDISEEPAPSATDSGRFLAAGAGRSYWVRTAVGELGHALGPLKRILEESPNTIIESNSLLNFIKPDLYLAVVDFTVADMKDSARRFLERADALVVTGGETPTWENVPARWLAGKPRFAARPPDWISPDLAAFVGFYLRSSKRTEESVVVTVESTENRR